VMTVHHDRPQNRLHLIFRNEGLIVQTEWIAENATIDIGSDGGPVSVVVYNYYTNPKWPITEDHLRRYALLDWEDDLKTIYNGFFNRAAKLKFQGMRVKR